MNKERKINLIFLLSLILIVFVVLNGVSATDTNLTTVNNTGVLSNSVNVNDNGNQSSNDLLVQSDNYSNNYPETLSVADMKTVCNGSAQLKSNEISSNSLGVSDSDILYISPNGYGTGTSINDTTNFADAYIHINDGGTIYFTNGNYTKIYDKEISKNLNLIAYNNANVTINATGQGYIFYCSNENANINITGITFADATGYRVAKLVGGAIYSKSNLTLKNCQFINNSAMTLGGAVYVTNYCTIINSTFLNNYAGNGGAIASNKQLNITQSVFKYNNVLDTGGAIYINGNCNLNGNILVNNTSKSSRNTIFSYDGNLNADYNWWGNNTPFDGTDFNQIIYSTNNFVEPNNWVIMNFTSTSDFFYPSSENILTVTLNNTISKSNVISDLPSEYSLGNSTVTYTTIVGSLNPTSAYFTNSTTTTFSIPLVSSTNILTATVDNQVLTLTNPIHVPDTLYVNGSYTGDYVDGTITYPFHNITDAINHANTAYNNVTIYIMNGTYNDVNMTINNNIVISAYNNDNVIIDALKKGYIFYIKSSKTLTITGLTLMNGTGYVENTYNHGGAIYSLGILNCLNTTFVNNNASDGGAINGMDVLINNSIFKFNNASEGGAIEVIHNCNVNNSQFFNNTASISAGAIYSRYESNITNSVFINNSADQISGTIYSYIGNINGNVFINNTANSNAKDITINGDTNISYNWYGNNTPFTENNNLIFNMTNSINKFITPSDWVILTVKTNNNIIKTLLDSYTDGNTINTLPDDIVIPERTTIFNDTNVVVNPSNTKTISFYTGTDSNTVTVTVDNQSLEFNVKGGDYPYTLYVDNSYTGYSLGTLEAPFKSLTTAINIANKINHNVTVYIMSGTYNDVNMTITNNLTVSAYENSHVVLDANKNGYIFYGIGVSQEESSWLNNYSLTVIGLTFSNGTGYDNGVYGGAIYFVGDLNVINSTFINNLASSQGGAISSYNCNIFNTTFINNNATEGGAIFALNNCNVSNSNFMNNNAVIGVIYSDTFNITGSVIVNNTVPEGKSLIYAISPSVADYNWWGSNEKPSNLEMAVTVNNWIIMTMELSNKSMYSNGKIEVTINLNSISYSDEIISDLNLPNRTVYLNTESGSLEFKVANFTNNITDTYTAPNDYGIYEINATIDNQTLSTKVAVIPNSNTYYVNGTYTGNIVDGSKEYPFHNISDAVKFLNYANNITIYIMNGTYTDIDMSIFTNMTISAYENDTVTLDANKKDRMFESTPNTVFTVIGLNFINGNSDEGGAISSLGTLNVINCIFTNNTAKTGGSICSRGINNIINSSFNYNTATDAGGAVVSDEDCNVIGCIFQNNNGGEMCGAVGAENVNVTGSIFVNNTAKIGKDIYYTKTVYCDYNWWGNNTPFTESNELIYYQNLDDENLSTYKNPSNWIIMTLTTNANNVNEGDTLTLTVSLNTINSTTGTITDLPNNISLPNRTVIFTSNYGTFNPSTVNFNDTVKSTYTATNAGNNVLYATIDNQTLNTTVIVNSNVVISPISTSIVNTQLISYVNGSVIVYVVDGGNIVNVGNVNVLLNNKAIGSGNVHNGQAIINITGVDVGNYNVTVFYFGKEPFESTSKTLNLTILANPKDNITINVPNITVKPGVNSTINVNLTDNDNNPINEGTVSVNVDGVNYTANVINGSAIINYTAPNTTGVYNITVTYTNGTYSTTVGSIINVTNITNFSVLVGYNLTETYDSGANYTGKLVDNLGNPISGQHIALNLTRLSDGKSKIYWVTTDTLGEYQLQINLSPGNYTVEASYKGNENYTGSDSGLNTITVTGNHISTVLTANNFLEPFDAGLNFTGKLTDNQGNPVIGQHIALNLTRLDTGASKIYWVTTDTLGEYQLAINLWTANYTAQCSYAGTSQYSSSSANATITVN